MGSDEKITLLYVEDDPDAHELVSSMIARNIRS
jgi:hypothetical protein